MRLSVLSGGSALLVPQGATLLRHVHIRKSPRRADGATTVRAVLRGAPFRNDCLDFAERMASSSARADAPAPPSPLLETHVTGGLAVGASNKQNLRIARLCAAAAADAFAASRTDRSELGVWHPLTQPPRPGSVVAVLSALEPCELNYHAAFVVAALGDDIATLECDSTRPLRAPCFAVYDGAEAFVHASEVDGGAIMVLHPAPRRPPLRASSPSPRRAVRALLGTDAD